jgi:hypothetical protein
VIALLVVAAIVVSAPLGAAVLVTLASLREDADHTLAGRAPGWMTSVARRVLRAQTRGVGGVPPRGGRPARPGSEDMGTRTLTGPRA